MRYLLDTNIIIYHLNGDEIATDFIEKNKEICAISRITWIEVLSYNFSTGEEIIVKKFLDSFLIIDTSKAIAEQAITNRKNSRIKVPDNIISSTAQVKSLIVVTRNEKDFKNIEVEILNIYS